MSINILTFSQETYINILTLIRVVSTYISSMSVRDIAVKQYQTIVNKAVSAFGDQARTPLEGWIATTRKSLGMSAAQLAKRLRLTRARVSQAEQAEPEGGVTLKTMDAMAKAMGCRFVYAIIPETGRVEDIITAQARRKAQALVGKASTHMALESQSLSQAQNDAEIERIAAELVRTKLSHLWTET